MKYPDIWNISEGFGANRRVKDVENEIITLIFSYEKCVVKPNPI